VRKRQFDEARGLWVESVLHMKRTSVMSGAMVYDLWGSESDRFVVYIAVMQSGTFASQCNQSDCPQRIEFRHSTEITLK